MRKALLKGHVFAVLLVNLLLAGGCQIGRRVNVIATDEICRKSVEVHLVEINRFEKDLWEQMSMTDYWTPGNQVRQSAKHYTWAIQFGQGACKQILSPRHPIQKIWRDRNAEYLFVLADLPGTFSDMPGNADARRVRLPALDSKCWGLLQREINISIESGKVVPLTISKSKNCD
ncbi:MAG: hypothetical protein JXA81_04080 [Sedimentisphaerales bacterium]|nr:hypothetical protein [Sedimentisphaerales bacterium]